MIDQHARRDTGIPSLAAARFEHEILATDRRVEFVGIISGGAGSVDGMQAYGTRCRQEGNGREPPDLIEFFCIEIGRSRRIDIVGSRGHQVEFVHAGRFAVRRIIRVVKIRQAERMREFVAGSADRAHRGPGSPLQFRRAEIAVQLDIVKSPAAVIDVVAGMQIPGMRPDGIGRSLLRFVIAGIIEHDEIHDPVTIIVVPGKVHRSIQLLGGMDEGHLGQFVVAIGVVAAIVGHVIVQLHRPQHLELGSEKPEGILVEVIVHRADGVVGGIAHLHEQRRKIAAGLGEGTVLEPHQDDGNPRRAEIG